ncbi:MAG: signal peptidase I [Firmicutes bacterium]|nr:signal peptidase I [Bacillota bacterium]
MFKVRIENPFLRGLVEWILVIGLALLLALIARSFLFRITRVTGYSMEPSLSHGDVLILNRFTYLFRSPAVGDIVAFPYPKDPSDFFIKRVVAVSGDTVDFHNSQFWVNGLPLDDSFSVVPVLSIGDMNFPVTVEEGHLFLLGDNRNVSRDSRCTTVGTVPESEMLGKVFIRFWPISSFGRVE